MVEIFAMNILPEISAYSVVVSVQSIRKVNTGIFLIEILIILHAVDVIPTRNFHPDAIFPYFISQSSSINPMM